MHLAPLPAPVRLCSGTVVLPASCCNVSWARLDLRAACARCSRLGSVHIDIQWKGQRIRAAAASQGRLSPECSGSPSALVEPTVAVTLSTTPRRFSGLLLGRSQRDWLGPPFVGRSRGLPRTLESVAGGYSIHGSHAGPESALQSLLCSPLLSLPFQKRSRHFWLAGWR